MLFLNAPFFHQKAWSLPKKSLKCSIMFIIQRLFLFIYLSGITTMFMRRATNFAPGQVHAQAQRDYKLASQEIFFKHAKSKIRAPKMDESAIRCHCPGSSNSLKFRFEFEIRAKLFSKSAYPLAYSPPSELNFQTLICDSLHERFCCFITVSRIFNHFVF